MLLLARGAVDRGLLAEGREALERAETRLLNVNPAPAAMSTPSAVGEVVAARQMLDRRDRAGARAGIDRALAYLEVSTVAPSPIASAPPPPVTALPPIAGPAVTETAAEPPPASRPIITRALRAGRWELQPVAHAWIPPDTAPQRVAPGRTERGRWVWRENEYRWQSTRVETR